MSESNNSANGKGDRNRTTNKKAYRKNYERIFPTPDPRTVKLSLDAFDRGDFKSTQEVLDDIHNRV